MLRVAILFLCCLSLSTSLTAKEEVTVTASELTSFFSTQEAYYADLGLLPDTLEVAENTLLVCEDGAEMLVWVLELLRHAQQSIEISGSFCGGSSFRDCLTIIGERMEACDHLQASILSCITLLEPLDMEMVEELQNKYPERFHFQVSVTDLMLFPDFTAIDNHIKMVVVDETYYVTGGTNLDETMTTDGLRQMPKNNKGGIVGATLPTAQRDTDVIGRGPMARQMRLEFFKHFALWKHYSKRKKLTKDPERFVSNGYFPIDETIPTVVEDFETSSRLIENVSIQMLVSGPHQRNKNVITKGYETLIDNAQEEIVIGNLYHYPMGNISQKLQKAVKRDVSLTLITNGFYEDSPFFCFLFGWANRSNFLPLFYGREYHFYQKAKCIKDPVYLGTKIYEYHVPDVLYHEKVMIVDKRISIIGSYNLGMRSHCCDYEMVFVIDSPEVARDLQKVLDLEIEHSEEISVKQARDWYFDPSIDFLARNQKKIHNFY